MIKFMLFLRNNHRILHFILYHASFPTQKFLSGAKYVMKWRTRGHKGGGGDVGERV